MNRTEFKRKIELARKNGSAKVGDCELRVNRTIYGEEWKLVASYWPFNVIGLAYDPMAFDYILCKRD